MHTLKIFFAHRRFSFFAFAALLLICASLSDAQTNTARMLSGVNYQTVTSYSLQPADTTRVSSFSNASAIAVCLSSPFSLCSGVAATGGQFYGTGSIFSVVNTGAGAVTITCSGCTINGAATLVLPQGAGADIYGDGVNFAVVQGEVGLTLTTQPGYWLSGDGTPWTLTSQLGQFGTQTAFGVKCLLSRLPSPLTVTHLSFRLNASGPNPSFIAIGVYTSAGNKVFSWDSINSFVGTPTTFSTTISAVTLQPGMYWNCSAGNYNSTGAASESGYAIPSSSYIALNSPFGTRLGTAANAMTVGGAMPATLGAITPTNFGQFAAWAMEP